MAQSDFLLSTDQNIQKEYINQMYTVSVPGTFSYVDTVIAHDLGYVPAARVWYEPIAGRWYPLTLTQLQDGTSGDFLNFTGTFSLSTTAITVSLANFSGSTADVNIWVRVYLDD